MIEVARKASPAFEFVPGESLLHRLDPAVKLALVLASSLLVFSVRSAAVLGSAAGLLVFLLFYSGVPPRGIRRDLTLVTYQLTMTFPLAFISEGFSWKAAAMIVTTTLRFTVMTVVASIVMRTTHPWRLLGALRPLVGERLAFLAVLASRYVPVLAGELGEIHAVQSARLRGRDAGGRAAAMTRAEALVIPFVQRAIRLAEELAVAVHARGMVPEGENDGLPAGR